MDEDYGPNLPYIFFHIDEHSCPPSLFCCELCMPEAKKAIDELIKKRYCNIIRKPDEKAH
jgi:hypothetical protein